MNLKRHPLSALFGDVSDDELSELAMDIKTIGQQIPGTLYEGMILDGWHRYLACQIAGVAFKSSELKAGSDPVAFVISRNVYRRHLTAIQRASFVVKCHEWNKSGRPKVQQDENHITMMRFPETKSNSDLAKIAKTSTATIQRAKEAEKSGLGDKVRSGEIKTSDIVPRSTPKPPAPSIEATHASKIIELEAELELHKTTINSLEEMLTDYETIKDEHATMTKILVETHGDQMTAALSEIKRLTALNRALDERIRGLQGERNMAIKAAKKAGRK